MRPCAVAAAAACLALVAAGCGGSSSAPQGQTPQTKTLVVAVSAPLSRDAYLGTTIANGTRLGAMNLVLPVDRDFYRLKIVVYDNAGSPSRAVANVRRAIAAGAVAIISDGTGIDASWRIANQAHVPIAIVYDGGTGLVDPRTRPNVFRIAPTNHGIAFRFAEYLVPKKLKVAFLTDDTGYGREGRASLDRAFAENGSSVVARIQIPSTSTDLAPQILQARRAGATALLVWAEPAGVAEAVIAARSSGWKVPVYTPPSGEDPLVRQELAARPDWMDGLTFAAGRMTAEQGPVPFIRFQQLYQGAFGTQEVGVKAADGRPIVQPPDYAMYPYDFVRVLGAAVRAAQSVDRETVLNALNQVSVEGANGDQRGFNQSNHEGVVDDDVYFARFSGMVFKPVKDDALSSTLPFIDQEG
jgi:ABC-type branched-subunit amino acid transport system substrate-binding protein